MKLSFKIYFFLVSGIPFISAMAIFSWKNCGNPTEPFRVTSLDIYSNQTKTFYLTGRVKVAINTTSPIQGQVLMQKKFFWGWTKIPCLDQIGSCIYEDICNMSPYLDKPCPSEFIANKLPCRCPILQGQYAAKKIPIDLNFLPQWIEEGNYRIQLKLSQDQTQLMCLIVYVTFYTNS